MHCLVIQIEITGFKYKNADSFFIYSSILQKIGFFVKCYTIGIRIKSRKKLIFTKLDTYQKGEMLRIYNI